MTLLNDLALRPNSLPQIIDSAFQPDSALCRASGSSPMTLADSLQSELLSSAFQPHAADHPDFASLMGRQLTGSCRHATMGEVWSIVRRRGTLACARHGSRRDRRL